MLCTSFCDFREIKNARRKDLLKSDLRACCTLLVFLSVLALTTSRVVRLFYPSTDSGRTCAPRLKLVIIISIIFLFVNTILFIYRSYILPYIYLYILLLPQKTHRSINVLYIIYTYRLYKRFTLFARELPVFTHKKQT